MSASFMVKLAKPARDLKYGEDFISVYPIPQRLIFFLRQTVQRVRFARRTAHM
jgi:hypothetical protein